MLTLAVNFDRIFVAGHASSFALRIGNAGSLPLTDIELTIESGAFTGPIKIHEPSVAAGTVNEHTLTPSIPGGSTGPQTVHFKITANSGLQHHDYSGDWNLVVNAEPASEGITVNISDIQSNRGGDKAGYGAVGGDVHIHDVIPDGAVQSLNDLLNLKLPEQFEFVPLRQPLDSSIPLRIPPRFLGRSYRTDELELAAAPEAECTSWKVLVTPEFILGRTRSKVHQLAWQLPRSEANDAISKEVSGAHVCVSMLEEPARPIAVCDQASLNGTFIDGNRIAPGSAFPIADGSLVRLGNYFSLRPRLFSPVAEGLPEISNISEWAGSKTQDNDPPCPLAAVRFDPQGSGSPDPMPIWCIREAVFGRSPSVPLRITDTDAPERLGRIFQIAGSFWIQVFETAPEVAVDEHPVRIGQAVPLTAGAEVVIGTASFRVQ